MTLWQQEKGEEAIVEEREPVIKILYENTTRPVNRVLLTFPLSGREKPEQKMLPLTMSWSSFFVTLTRKSFDKIMPAFSFQMVSYIHWMNAGGYDYSRHIHNHWLHYLVLHLMKNDVC